MRGLFRRGLLASVLLSLLAVPVAAQDMAAGDVQRLQDTINDISTDVAAMRKRDARAARTLQSELEQLEEKVIYLRVRQRREGRVPRAEYTDIRDKVEDLRARARGDNSRGGYGVSAPVIVDEEPGSSSRRRESSSSRESSSTARAGSIPVGTELDVRLQRRLNSGIAQVDDRFEATTLVDVVEDGRVLIPAGSVMRGVVSDVKPAGRVERRASMTLQFEEITVNRRDYDVRATVSEALESGGYRDDAGKIGAGAIVGGIIGGILGGGKGAVAGILIGGGGVVAATEGQEVDLDAGTVLRVRLDEPLALNR